MANPSSESKDEILKLDFDRRLMPEFRGSGSPLMPDCWPIANLLGGMWGKAPYPSYQVVD